jgi:FtsP/CotA-like multicopper oxidase with cupredoxin domain
MRKQPSARGHRWWTLPLPLVAVLIALTATIGMAQTTVPITSPNHPGEYGKMRSTTQAQRLAARQRQGKSKTSVSKHFAGVDQTSANLSPLASKGGKVKAPLASMNSGGIPDYFGAGNYANSPLPTVAPGPITAVQLLTGGGGYQNPTVNISDPTGTGASITATAVAGVVTSLFIVSGGTGYSNPTLTITDLNGISAGATAVVTGFGTLTGGMRKFVDTLPRLTAAGANDLGTYIPIAVPDTTIPAYAGSDYYRLGLQEFTHQFHRDLPGPCAEVAGVLTCGGTTAATLLRGYNDLNGGTDTASHYLGPLIIASKDRPVRVLFINNLTTNLNLPVDTTYMGAGLVQDGVNGVPNNSAMASQKRATLHLHGGNTPWISDGFTMQWATPAGGDGQPAALGFAKGFSTMNVPDMVGPGLSIPTPSLTDGMQTFYWTNQQSGRLLFYHDHAYGITRINVYDGEVAGYLIVDPAREDILRAATLPGTIPSLAGTTPPQADLVNADIAHLVPLIIQDKTFVPDSGVTGGQLAAQDPTWDVTNWGGFGSLWFPHVYTPNQNPSDPGGANPFGRWDWGPWFWPPQDPSTLLMQPYQCPGYPVGVMCPGVPNVSGTPESFMDTPVINGTAYPSLTVDPAAYRFQILDGANDRAWNLQLYYAVDKYGAPCKGGTTFDAASCTEVSMVPAIPHNSLSNPPLCTVATYFPPNGGQAEGAVDAAGNPLNGTGLPAGCWPTSWPTDSRPEGVPDPLLAGPAIIQIGNESGPLAAPTLIPSTPMGYEYNRRSITVLNMFSYGLVMGAAERADIVVDFSTVPLGSILIMYNDAPAPVPAFDPRIDYFTNDGDQSLTGGAPNTQPGYGPNTRTVMQIKVTGAGANNGFSLAALKAAFPNVWAVQPAEIVPETAYGAATDTYSHIFDTSLTFTPTGGGAPITMPMIAKTIQELFTLDYGRMNATLGVELPLTSFLTQTTIPYGYVDPATEIFQSNVPQIWKITHNGVDTHFIHFHLFDVQVINRVGWDGTIKPPNANELGWKDTVRMNPLEDIVVALRPVAQNLPWPLPDSIRPMDVIVPLGSVGSFTNVDPNNNPITVLNANQNFGREHVWHCHILGHEENDMMRPMVFQVPPAAPTLLAVQGAPTGFNFTFTDNAASESSFTLQRDTTNAFANPTNLTVPASVPSTAYGGTITYTDTTAPAGSVLYYRVCAVDDNFKPPLMQTFNATPALLSAWSNVVSTPAPLAITTTSPLPAGSQSSVYGPVTFAATGGVGAYTWSLASGSLPAGLTLSAAGVLSGTPTATGTFNFTIRVTDSWTPVAASATKAFTLTVSAAFSITTASPLPAGTVGTSYSRSFAATGGTTPYSWSISAGSIPPGLRLSSGGTLSGTPTAAGTYTFTIRVTDRSTPAKVATKVFSLTISVATLSITTASPLPNGVVGSEYTRSLAASGGTTPRTWAVISGALPAGVTLGTNGTFAGTPTTAGIYNFTVRVTDSSVPALTATKAFSLTIAARVAISTASPLPNGTRAVGYSVTFAATGGNTPYRWSLSAGTLPTGLTLSTGGVLSGTPTVSGTYNFTVRVTDSTTGTAGTATKAFSLRIN